MISKIEGNLVLSGLQDSYELVFIPGNLKSVKETRGLTIFIIIQIFFLKCVKILSIIIKMGFNLIR